MSVTYQDILSLAQDLLRSASKETDYRNVIGRAYYAAYHCCLSFHSALPSPGEKPPAFRGLHERLIYQLGNPTIDKSDPRCVSSKLLSQKLASLRNRRVTADYRLDLTSRQLDAQDAVIKAAAIISLTGQ